MIPDAGLNEIIKRIFGLSVNAAPYVAVGTSEAAWSAGDTALGAELVRVLASTVTASSNTVAIAGFFNTAQANDTIREKGLLTAASGGVLLDRILESPAQTKSASKELIVEYTITLENV